MRVWSISAILLSAVGAAYACSISYVPELWRKAPGSKSNLFAFEKNGHVGFIDSTGKVVIKPVLPVQIDRVGDFIDGLARVGGMGYIDETGNWAIKGDYSWAEDFSDGLALVAKKNGREEFTGAAYIDRTGKEVLQVPRFRTGAFSRNLAPFEAEGKPGTRSFQPGHFEYRDYPGLKGFIDRSGQSVIQPRFAQVGPFVDGLARVVLDRYCHIALPDGGRQGTPTTGYPSSCGGAPEDAVQVCPVGFIAENGNYAIEPRFESARDFSEGLAAVAMDGLWGFVDASGNLAIQPEYERAGMFSEGLAAVRISGKWGFVDKQGKLVIAPRFDRVEAFSEGLAIAYRGKRAFYIDRSGTTSLSGPFLEATPFVHGLAAVLETRNEVAYINKRGTVIFRYSRK